jgi:hypothetical protein
MSSLFLRTELLVLPNFESNEARKSICAFVETVDKHTQGEGAWRRRQWVCGCEPVVVKEASESVIMWQHALEKRGAC